MQKGLVGKNLKEWLDAKSGHVFSKKQQKLKKIGQFRHLAFDKWLMDRFLEEKWYNKGIDFRVFDVSLNDIDAIVFQIKGYLPLEVYELSNCSKCRLLRKKVKNPYVYVSKGNVFRYIQNLTKFNCKRYIVISYPENLTENALWEFAKSKIMIKVLGYQD